MTTAAPAPPSTTNLAVDRTRLAHERTLMAWVRTSTSLISFGFAIYKFFQYLTEGRGDVEHGFLGPRPFAVILIGIGLVTLVLATFEHRRNMRILRAQFGTVPYSLATVYAGLVAVLGILGFATSLLGG